MQSSLYAASNSHHYQNPWRTPEAPLTTPKFAPKNTKKTGFRTRHIASSLRTSLGYDSEESVGKEPGPRLPVAIQRSGKVSRYFWDGESLRLVGVDGGAPWFSLDFDDGVRSLARVCGLAVRDFFVPKKVSENYMNYVKWKFLHRVFSSALQVLATQVIGISYAKSRLLFLL